VYRAESGKSTIKFTVVLWEDFEREPEISMIGRKPRTGKTRKRIMSTRAVIAVKAPVSSVTDLGH
jgi:hypothetical protein